MAVDNAAGRFDAYTHTVDDFPGSLVGGDADAIVRHSHFDKIVRGQSFDFDGNRAITGKLDRVTNQIDQTLLQGCFVTAYHS